MNFLNQHSRGSLWILVPAGLLALAGLAADMLWLSCEAWSMLLVLLSLYSSRRHAPVYAALVGSLLTVLPLFLADFTLVAVADRAMSVVGVWLVAFLCMYWRNIHARMKKDATFAQSVLDALSSEIAVLDGSGRVVAVNEAWRQQVAQEDSPLRGCGLGSDYLANCPKSRPRWAGADSSINSMELAEGVRKILESSGPGFTVEYPFGATGRRWFSARVSRFSDADRVWAVVEQDDITVRKLAELDVERSRAAYRELATRDELTGIYNRRALDHLLAEEVGRYERYGNTVAFIMADIDHFKRINDEYGHPVGDAALQWLAGFLAKNVRVVDKVARYGGEEFGIIAPELNSYEACAMAERLRRIIDSHPFYHHNADGTTTEIPITVSFGVAAVPGDVIEASAVVMAADKALYAAKRCGRNCTVQFRELEEPLVP